MESRRVFLVAQLLRRLVVEIPWFTRVSYIQGGWEWDFSHQISFHLKFNSKSPCKSYLWTQTESNLPTIMVQGQAILNFGGVQSIRKMAILVILQALRIFKGFFNPEPVWHRGCFWVLKIAAFEGSDFLGGIIKWDPFWRIKQCKSMVSLGDFPHNSAMLGLVI